MKLRLDAFRGATQDVTIDFGTKKIVILYGENGCGKTTIVDAFDVLANGNEGSLTDKKGIGTKSRYLPSVQRDPKELEIDLTIGSNTWQVRKSGSKVTTSPDDVLPKVNLLRRQKISELIEAGDTDKYKLIRGFVEVPEIQANELALKELVNQLSRTEKSLTDELTTVEQMIGMTWADVGEDEQAGLDPVQWAKKEAAAYDPEWKSSKHPSQRMYELSGSLDLKLSGLNSAIEDEAKALESAATARNAFEKAALQSASESADTIDILLTTKAFLAKRATADELGSCPVCEQSLNDIDLAEKIPKRLSALQTVVEVKSELDQAERSASAAESRVEAARTSAKDAFVFWDAERSRGDHEEEVPDPGKLDAFLEGSESDYDLSDFSGKLRSFCDLLELRIQSWGAVNQRRQTMAQQIEKQEDCRTRASENTQLLTLAKGAYEIVQQTRKDFVDSVLKEISSNVAEFYREIHPDENLEDIKMLLNPKQAGALQIKSSAYDQEDLIPQGFYSESHLDTLGICIFLALARREGSDDTILIVDDAITSVDERHLERLVKLLYRQSEDFKRIILTSHYRPWREKYRWGHLRHNQSDFIELRDWSPERGLQHTRCDRLPVERIRELLIDENAAPGEAVALSGVLLECLLDFISLTYRCKMERKPSGVGWTIGELFSCLGGKLQSSLRVERMRKQNEEWILEEEVFLGPLLVAISDLKGLRNCMGCHYNELGAQFSAADAREFADATLALAEAICDTNGGLPNSDKSGEYWESSDRTRRLYPLQKPR